MAVIVMLTPESFLELLQKAPRDKDGKTNIAFSEKIVPVESVRAIADALASGQCPADLTIVLSGNNIDSDCIVAIADALASGQCPKNLTLNFRGNNITDPGAQAFAKMLQSKQYPINLTVDFSFNNISPEGAQAIAEALCQNKINDGLILLFDEKNVQQIQKVLFQKIDQFQVENTSYFQRKNITPLINAIHALESLWPDTSPRLLEAKRILYPIYFRANLIAHPSLNELDALFTEFCAYAKTEKFLETDAGREILGTFMQTYRELLPTVDDSEFNTLLMGLSTQLYSNKASTPQTPANPSQKPSGDKPTA